MSDKYSPMLHPLYCLNYWQDIYADALSVELTERATVDGAANWLDTMLGSICAEKWVPVEKFARDLRACRKHVERVLHDGEQVERGAPCLACESRNLELTYGPDFRADRWVCSRRDCGATYTRAQYRGVVETEARNRADWLRDRDIEVRLGVKAGTVREWARLGLVKKREHEGRKVYRVEDVKHIADEKGMMSA